MKNIKSIYISWTKFNWHATLSSNSFGAKAYFISSLITSRGFIWKLLFFFDYFYKSLKTVIIIVTNKPDIVITENPPPVGPIIAVFLKILLKYKVIIDSHNGAFEPPMSTFPFHLQTLIKADLVIVHNYQLKEFLEQNKKFEGVKFYVLNDPLPRFEEKSFSSDKEKYFLVVTTFHGDEPMEILLEGIRLFNENYKTDITFRITGNYNKRPLLYAEHSRDKNVKFTGFVDQSVYHNLLLNAIGIISLSTRDNVQQFALMEAIGAGVPFISTDNSTNRDLFNDTMILSKNEAIEIARSINVFIERLDEFKKHIPTIKTDLTKRWKDDFSKIKKQLDI